MFERFTKRMICFIVMAGLLLWGTGAAMAGNISSTDKYAWGANTGWNNFEPSNGGGVTVYDDHLEGYAWAENVGWIRLGTHTTGGAHTYTNASQTTYGVNHDGSGNLSGYAWGVNVGWINFNPANSQVTVNTSTGDFDGYAWGENIGWIHFQNDSPAYKVVTIWRPNAAPDITGVTPDSTTIAEGSSISLGGSFTDTDEGDSHDVTISWGDSGTDTTFTLAADTFSFSGRTHTYADNASYTVTVTVNDGTDLDSDDSTDITVSNVAPTLILSGDASVLRDSTYTLGLSAVTDPGDDTVSGCTVNWGDGNSDSCTPGGNVTHSYSSTGSKNITTDLTDEDGAHTAVASKTVEVVIPLVAFSSATYSDEENVETSNSVTLSRTVFTNCVTEVSVSVTGGDATGGTDYDSGFPVTVTFNEGDDSRTVSVPVTGDAVDEEDETVIFSVSSVSNADIGTQDTATLTITDDDTRGITVTPTSGLVTTESGGTATFTVVLDSQPTADVTIGISSDTTGEGTVSTDTLIFTADNWNVAQTVTVTGTDDSSGDGSVAYNIVTAAATGGDYAGIDPDDVSVTNSDNDTPGITVTPTELTADEPSGTADFVIKLNTRPTGDADVSVPLSASGPCTLSVTSPAIIVNTEWETGVTVTVTAEDDSAVNPGGERICTVSTGDPASDDSDYGDLGPDDATDVTVTVQDDDTAEFEVSDISGDTTEAGGTATFTVRLTSEPSADVTVAVSSDDTTEGTVSPESLTFGPGDWDAPQTVTVTGEDDKDEDGDVDYSIVLAAAESDDTDYDGTDPPDVSVTNTDDPSEYDPGDVNGDGSVDLKDAILCLKILAGITDTAEVILAADVNDDGRIGFEELFFVLKKLAE